MCGIYGYIGNNYKSIEPVFSKQLHHRGPDDKGIFYDDAKKLVIGHTRLSIIDLSKNARQPMLDENNNYVLVFNGEIYNYKEIRKELKSLGYKFKTSSDSEVVLNSYIEWKEKSLEKFRGMFAFCIYDKGREKLFLARDRFGIKPLIYGIVNKQLVFSSELKPILNTSLFPKMLNYKALSDYFKYGSIRQPDTILKNFYFLMPSSYMEVDVNNLDYNINRYYDLVERAFELPKIKTYPEAVKLTREYLEEATKYHMIADVEVGAFLSGGIDSTSVVALMQKYSKQPINTFSVGFKNKTDVIDETDIATRSAKFLGTKHHNVKVDDGYVLKVFDDFIKSLDQPSIDGLNTYIVSLETGKSLKVALSGLGGDEIFAGYPHFKTIPKFSSRELTLFSKLIMMINSIKSNKFTNKYEYYGVDECEAVEKQRTINKRVSQILKKTISKEFRCDLMEDLSSIQKISYHEINNYLLNTLLRDVDSVSMAHSLEVRPVLLDHKLMEFVFSLPDEFKIRGNTLKSIFIDSVKDIIPSDVWKRKKTGFELPFSMWMNGKLNEKFKYVLNNKKIYELFHFNYLEKLKNRINSLKLKRKDWMIFVFLSWFDAYKVDL